MLTSPQCRSQPPTLLLDYLPALTAASCQLLDRFLSDPTAYGVSLAFVESEQQLEGAFLPWCSVIGSAFATHSRSRSTGSIGPHKLTKRPSKQTLAFDRWKPPEPFDANSTNSTTCGGSSGIAVSRVFRRLRRGSTPSQPMCRDNSSAGSLMTDSTHSSDQHISPPPSVPIPAGPPAHVFRRTGPEDLTYTTSHRRNLYPHDSRRYLSCLEANGSREPSRTRSFQDLAILPTQRVMRYVLLFRGGSKRTRVPTFSSMCLQTFSPTLVKPAAIAQWSRRRWQRRGGLLKSATEPRGIPHS